MSQLSRTWKSLKPTASQTSQNKNWLDVVEKLEGFSQDVYVWVDFLVDHSILLFGHKGLFFVRIVLIATTH